MLLGLEGTGDGLLCLFRMEEADRGTEILRGTERVDSQNLSLMVAVLIIRGLGFQVSRKRPRLFEGFSMGCLESECDL